MKALMGFIFAITFPITLIVLAFAGIYIFFANIGEKVIERDFRGAVDKLLPGGDCYDD